ncbi:hypothetical protein RKD24_004190 [Streptomyces calvus]
MASQAVTSFTARGTVSGTRPLLTVTTFGRSHADRFIRRTGAASRSAPECPRRALGAASVRPRCERPGRRRQRAGVQGVHHGRRDCGPASRRARHRSVRQRRAPGRRRRREGSPLAAARVRVSVAGPRESEVRIGESDGPAGLGRTGRGVTDRPRSRADRPRSQTDRSRSQTDRSRVVPTGRGDGPTSRARTDQPRVGPTGRESDSPVVRRRVPRRAGRVGSWALRARPSNRGCLCVAPRDGVTAAASVSPRGTASPRPGGRQDGGPEVRARVSGPAATGCPAGWVRPPVPSAGGGRPSPCR